MRGKVHETKKNERSHQPRTSTERSLSSSTAVPRILFGSVDDEGFDMSSLSYPASQGAISSLKHIRGQLIPRRCLLAIKIRHFRPELRLVNIKRGVFYSYGRVGNFVIALVWWYNRNKDAFDSAGLFHSVSGARGKSNGRTVCEVAACALPLHLSSRR